MSDATTIGSLMLNDALPDDFKLKGQALDKKELTKLLRGVAERYPDKYKAVLKTLNDVGRSAAYQEGVTVSLSGLRKTDREKAIVRRARARVRAIAASDMDPAAKKQALIDTMLPMVEKMQTALKEEAEAEDNPYWFQIKSGARGKMGDFNAIRGASGLVNDHRNELVPVPILHSLGEGLDPVEYWAGTYGQRRGMIDVKFAVGDAGFLNKQLVNAAHRLLVNKEKPPETRLPVGLPVEIGDEDNIGSVLARDAGPYKAGTTITKDMLEQLRDDGVEHLLIHSPMTEPSSDGGISRWAAGRRDRAGLSYIGDNIGIPAAQSLGERLSQGMLDCLVEGTEVRMADWSVKPIQDLRPGDWVLGADRQGNTFPVEVNHLFDQGMQPCWEWRFKVGSTRASVSVQSTTEHKVLANIKKYSCAAEARNHDLQVVPIGTRAANFYGVYVKRHEPKQRTSHYTLKRQKPTELGMKRCWDIEVNHPDHLFVLANGLIVSNSKHQAGATGTDKVSRSGFAYINRLIQSPEVFPEAGPLSEAEGVVRKIQKAPQGGHYIHVDDQEYYAGPGINPIVGEGQSVDVGDDLTDGTPHPEQLVRLKGIGEARRRYLQILREGLENSGINFHRRNAEAVVAGLLNWTKVTNPDGIGDHIVDDVVSYNSIAGDYQPREGFEALAPNRSIGRYLEEPVLHYTPGTRVSKAVAEDLKKWGIKDVRTHADEPYFRPYMQRGMLGVYNDEDWQTRLSGFYTTSAFLDSVHRGRTSDPNSTSFVPAIAQGTGFGQDLETRGTYGGSGVVSPSPATATR